MSDQGMGQSAQIGRNRAIDINNRPPGVDIETLKQSNPDTNRVLDWFESRLESLQRENEERPPEHLPSCRKLIYDIKSSPCTCRTEYDRLCTEVDMLRRDRDAWIERAITPEMRERIEATAALWDLCQRTELNGDVARDFAPCAIDLLRDLLGERG